MPPEAGSWLSRRRIGNCLENSFCLFLWFLTFQQRSLAEIIRARAEKKAFEEFKNGASFGVDDESLIGPRTDTPHADTPHPTSSWILAPGSFPSHGTGAMGTTLRRVILRAVGFEHEDQDEDDFEPPSEGHGFRQASQARQLPIL